MDRLFRSLSKSWRKFRNFVAKLVAIIIVVLVIVALYYMGLSMFSDKVGASTYVFVTAKTGTFLASVQVYHLWIAASVGVFLGYAFIPDAMSWAMRRAYVALRHVGELASNIFVTGAGVLSKGLGAILSSPVVLLAIGAFLVFRKPASPAPVIVRS